MTATTPIAAPGSGSGYMPQEGLVARVLASKPFAVTVIVAAIIAIWYAFAVYLNTQWQLSVYQRGNVEWTAADLVRDTLNQDRPVLPSPHQVVVEIWNTTVMMSPTSRRSLLYHAWITLSATLLGFVIGTALGMAGRLASSTTGRWTSRSCLG
jgi:NitT/TauT family transport system permease protein